MSIGRPAIVAGQAIVVGVLVVVVYLTLLQPEQKGTLSAVEAPAGAPVSQGPAGGGDHGGRRDGERRERHRGHGGAGGGAAPTFVAAGAPAPAPVGAVPLASVAPVGAPDGDSQSPISDQYQNAVSRIDGRLR